jgi:hypothetical protein
VTGTARVRWHCSRCNESAIVEFPIDSEGSGSVPIVSEEHRDKVLALILEDHRILSPACRFDPWAVSYERVEKGDKK